MLYLIREASYNPNSKFSFMNRNSPVMNWNLSCFGTKKVRKHFLGHHKLLALHSFYQKNWEMR